MITKEIRLKLWEKNNEIFYAVKGEVDARCIKVYFLSEDETNLSLSGKTVKFYARKPDGTQIYNNCDVSTSDNSVTVSVTSQMVSVLGIVECEFQIFNSENDLLKVNGLRIIVTSKGNFTEAVESTSEFNALVTALNQVENLPTDAVKDVKVNGKLIAKDSNKVVNITVPTKIPTFEQGAWTPQLACTYGAAPTYTLTTNKSYYFRIDNLVYINLYIHANVTDVGGGLACLEGLPFEAKNGAARHCIGVSLIGNFNEDTVVIADEEASCLYFTSKTGDYRTWTAGNFFLSASGCYLREV